MNKIAIIPMGEMEPRRLYRIRSRNLVVGVWRPETRGFIGIREKFGDLYLFEEFHTETGFGTVSPIHPIGENFVPDEIQLAEYLPHSPEDKYLRINQALFDWLRPFDEAANAQIREENERAEQERLSLAYKPKTKAEVEQEERREAANKWMQQQFREARNLSREERAARFKEIDAGYRFRLKGHQ